ncbi:hypothetical protein [Bacillus thuringiensis]|uniref:Uncharacterized protein n=1 Tax=Bacillus thuringiensis TaxID=1428 RepID=A0ABD6RCX0_BACTU|nr:hypothetical protein [Bacillus thuringiensis]OPD53358.1 hypothetical protein BVF97_07770 [Bacillus thuringiensis]
MTRNKTVANAEILSVIEGGKKLVVRVSNFDGTKRTVYVVKEEKEEKKGVKETKYELIDYEEDVEKEIIEKIMHDKRFKPFLAFRLIILFK